MTALTHRHPKFFERRGIVQLPEEDACETIPMLFSKHGKSQYRNRLYDLSPHCRFCGRKIAKREDATVDHLLPESQGGENTPWNLALACEQCNGAKGARTIEQWVDDILHGAEPCNVPGVREGGVA